MYQVHEGYIFFNLYELFCFQIFLWTLHFTKMVNESTETSSLDNDIGM